LVLNRYKSTTIDVSTMASTKETDLWVPLGIEGGGMKDLNPAAGFQEWMNSWRADDVKLIWIRHVISMDYNPQRYSDAFHPFFLMSIDTLKLLDNRSLTWNRHNFRHNGKLTRFFHL
jgi:hypothetical protein